MKSSIFFLTGDAKVLDLIRAGDEDALVMLYESSRRPIVDMILRNNGSADDAEDILQEAVIVLWERVRAGKFEYKAKLSTFVYATARNLWSGRLRKRGREVAGELDPDGEESPASSALEEMIGSEQSAMISAALGKIGEQCRKLLILFYWDEQSMEAIAAELGFANSDTVKAKKYQCKKALEDVVRRMGK
jgi:RNA polymerase sigma factor (sigma-70 family)